MKRSEMLKRMKEEYNNWLSYGLEDHEIEWILSFLEREGMLPPPYFDKEDLQLKKDDPDYFNERLYFGYEGIRKWEPENE